ncbi:MAG: cation diffusion facilitator family transporter [Nitrososphaerales archaeon]
MQKNEAQRAKSRAATLSMASAAFLTVIKLSVGLATNSLAILSLAVDSFLDIAGSGTTYFSVRISGRPPDSEHLYGHGKMENLGGLLVTTILLITVGYLVYESLNRLFTIVPIAPGVGGVAGLMVCIAVDIGLSWHLKRTATRYNSQVLEANSLQFRMDIWTQSIVIIGLIFVTLGYHIIDPLIALLVSGYIAYLGLGLGKKAIDILLDRAPADIVKRIDEAVKGVEEVVKYENLRVRTSGPQTFVDMRIYVPRIFPLEKAHNIASEVEGRIKGVVPDADVMVHVEAEEDKENVADKIRLIATSISRIKGIHDLWVRRVEGVFEIDAHIQVDSEISLSEAHEATSLLEDRLKKEFGSNSTVTTHIDTEVDRIIYQKPLKESTPSITKTVEKIVSSLEEVKSCDNISLKHFDSELHVSISCTLKKDLKVKDAHAVASKIEVLVTTKVDKVSKVFVHTEPPSG